MGQAVSNVWPPARIPVITAALKEPQQCSQRKEPGCLLHDLAALAGCLHGAVQARAGQSTCRHSSVATSGRTKSKLSEILQA